VIAKSNLREIFGVDRITMISTIGITVFITILINIQFF
jgi:hypothetical protein